MIKTSVMRRLAAVALVSVLSSATVVSVADARMGGGSSFGSRGSRSFSMPPSTSTAPRGAQSIPGIGTPQTAPGFPGGYSQPPRRFGFGSGLAAGLFGAGLFGMLTGNGFFGGIGGLASLFGMLFQIALIGGLGLLLFRMFRSRGTAFAGAGGPGPSAVRYAPDRASFGGGAPTTQPISITSQDYAAFEQAIVGLQTAYGREDIGALARMTTPEVLGVLEGDLRRNGQQGLRNEVTQPRLLQGDLSEAWREGQTDFATVAMRFSIVDVMVERATGRIVSGRADQPTEATELWTFCRTGRLPWLVSAIQQAR